MWLNKCNYVETYVKYEDLASDTRNPGNTENQ